MIVVPVAFPLDVPPVDGIELEPDVVLPGCEVCEVELFDGYVELPGFVVELVSLGEELMLDAVFGELELVSPEADAPERLPALFGEELPDEVDALADPETPSAPRVCESS